MENIKLIIAQCMNKKIINKCDILGLYNHFFYKNKNIYAVIDSKYIYFCNFLHNNVIDVYHWIYEKNQRYYIINKYIKSSYWNLTIYINKQELKLEEQNLETLNIDLLYLNKIKAQVLLMNL